MKKFIKTRSVELQCHVLDEGRRKNTLSTDMDIAAHAIAWEPLCYPLYSLKISYVFIYKISITLLSLLICLERVCAQSGAKVWKI